MDFIANFTWIIAIVVTLAFIFELMDAAMGIGFGTTFTPVLLIMKFDVAMVVPSILLSELVAGVVASFFHTLLQNVRFKEKRILDKKEMDSKNKTENYSIDLIGVTTATSNLTKALNLIRARKVLDEPLIDIEITSEEEKEEEKRKSTNSEESKPVLSRLRSLTTDSKVIIILSIIGISSAVVAAIVHVLFDFNEWFNFGVKIYISLMVLIMGILILLFRNKTMKFSMKKIVGLGFIAGFNKGISGGGYRPVTVVGQMLSGREGKSALASTTFSKTAVCLVGTIAYVVTHIIESASLGTTISWEYLELVPYLMIGTVLAAPIGAFITKKVEGNWLKISVGIGTIFLGIFSLIRISLFQAGIWL